MMIHFLFIVCFVVGITGCTPKPENDCGFVQNVYGQRISWKSLRNKIALEIDPSVPIELRPAIYRAAATWERELGTKVFAITENITQKAPPAGRDQKNTIYFLSEWESDKSSEQGRTSVFWVGDAIQEADIRINAADFSYYDLNPQRLIGSRRGKNQVKSRGTAAADGYRDGNRDGYSFEALVLHELGHFLGLKHRPGESVMVTHLGAYANRVGLASADRQAVACEYH